METWVWEYVDRDGAVLFTERYGSLCEVKAIIDECFSDYRFEEIERRGIWGTAVAVYGHEGYRNSRHWIYRLGPDGFAQVRGPVVIRRRPRSVLPAWRSP